MNPNLAAFGQMAGGPQMPPQMPPGAPPGAGAPSPGMGGPPPAMAPQGAPQAAPQRRYTPQEMAALGRYGDKVIAHLTPGEIEVPPQVQTPKLLVELRKAFTKAGVSPAQFTAGSPQSSTNPQTGVPEYNFLSALMPMLAGGAASIFAPELLPGMSPWLAGALGGAAAGGLGSSLTGGNFLNGAMLGGLSGGLGGAAGLGGLMSNGAPAPLAMSPESAAAAQAAPNQTSFLNGLLKNPAAMGVAGLGAGALLANAGNGTTSGPSPAYPPGFTTPMTPFGQLGSAQGQLGQNQYRGPMPNMAGYNPLQVGMNGGWNFFPTPTV